jgi:Nuclease-related domain
MAEYQRRRQLYAAERRDTVARTAVLGGGVILLVSVVVAMLTTFAGAGVLTTVRLVGATVVLVGAGALARYYRLPTEIESWREDAEAERRTARALDRLARAGYTVMHDRRLPDSAGNVDHLIIGPSGAWVVETDAHRGQYRQNRAGPWVGKVPLRPMLGLVTWMSEEITNHLVQDLPEGWQLEAQPVVAFARAEVPQGLALLDGVLLLPAAGVAEYILSAGVVLKPLDVAMLVDVAERTFPPYPVPGPPPPSTLSRLRGLLRR